MGHKTIKRATLLLLAVAAFCVSACSSFDVPDLKEEVEREQIIPANWQPLPYRVGVAPARAALETDAQTYNVEDTTRWVLTPDEKRLESLHAQMLTVLRDYKMFENTTPVEGVTDAMDRQEIIDLGLEQGLDIVVFPVVKRHDVGYVDSNGLYGWNMFVWWMVSPIITWLIADEDFDANLHVELQLYPTSGDFQLDKMRLQPEETLIRSFDDFDEGFNLFSIFSTPGHFDEENWQRIGERMMPIAEVETQKATLKYVTGRLAKETENEEFREAVRRRVGVVFGVDGSGRKGLPLSRYAANDAAALGAQFVDARNDGLVESGTSTLIGPRATRRAVLDAVGRASRLARFNDDIYLSFAGVGRVTDKKRVELVTSLPVNADKVEVVGLDEVVKAAIANTPRTLVLTLDCSFLTTEDKRCATSAEVIESLADDFDPFASVRKICSDAGVELVIVAANGAGKHRPAAEIEDLGAGLFSSYLVSGLAGKADANSDRDVTVKELRAYLNDKVGRIAGLEGLDQQPYVFATKGRENFVLPSWRK